MYYKKLGRWSMKLFEYLKGLQPLLLNQNNEKLNNHELSIVTDDSRKIEFQGLFFAIPGLDFDGHDYIDEAISRGAKSIVYQKQDSPKISGVNYLLVEDVRLEYNKYLLWKNRTILEELKVIGITGTNGKTTVASVTYYLLKYLQKNVAYVGTNGTYIYANNKNYYLNTPNTTPKLEIILNSIENYYPINYLILEVSSEALKAKRIEGLNFDIVVYTNLGHDHLNAHLTETDYLASKLKLFSSLKQNGQAIINADDNYAKQFIEIAEQKQAQIYTYGLYEGMLKGEVLKLTSDYMMCKIMDKDLELIFGTNLLGKFNLSNLLASLLIMKSENYEIITLLDYFSNIINIPGRYQFLEHHQKKVLIDYAHNPEAVKEMLLMLNQIKGNAKIITIIGAGGKKDIEKRPKMGKIATTYSDYVIFTEDTSRGEDLLQIIKDLISDITSTNYEIVLRRPDAIHRAFELANSNDYLAILGMGSDKYGPNNEFTDLKVVQKVE